jgi:hypothetical protein
MKLWLKLGSLYFLAVFALGFLLGTVRVLWLIPRVGDTLAVILEVPVMLAFSWVVIGKLLARTQAALSLSERALVGVSAFVLLMSFEFALSVFVFAKTPAQYLSELLTTHGLIGLVGQVVFGVLPVFRPKGE